MTTDQYVWKGNGCLQTGIFFSAFFCKMSHYVGKQELTKQLANFDQNPTWILLGIHSSEFIHTKQLMDVFSLLSGYFWHRGLVSWRLMTVKWWVFTVQPSVHHWHSTNQVSWSVIIICEQRVRRDYTFADDGNTSWCSVCRVPMVEWWLDCENCCHFTIVSLHDTGPWTTS